MSATGDFHCEGDLNHLRFVLLETAASRSLFYAKDLLKKPCSDFLHAADDREGYEHCIKPVRAIQDYLNHPQPHSLGDIVQGLKEWSRLIEAFEQCFRPT